MSEYGLMPGRYPAIVRQYNAQRRTCRVEIPGLTDGGEVLPEAEIEYPIGDKSRGDVSPTEIEMLSGDTVWIAFIGGDPRYPIITGYRNAQSGNSGGWRRWHHTNIELLADELLKCIAKGDVLIQSDSKITFKAPEIVHESAQTTMNGSASVGKGLSVLGGGGASSAIKGIFKIVGGLFCNDKDVGDTHTHAGVQSGDASSGAVN